MSVRQVVALSSILALAGTVACSEKETLQRRISRSALEDKVRSGWAGQMIGVAFGAPTEFQSNGKIIEGELEWTSEMIGNTIQQDDLYVEMTFAEVMDTVVVDRELLSATNLGLPPATLVRGSAGSPRRCRASA